MVKLNSGNWLTTEDAVDGGLVKFVNEGEWVESTRYTYPDGNPKQDFVIKLSYNGTEYDARINKLSRDELIPAYGNDTANWVGKEAKIKIVNYPQLKKDGIVFYPVKEDGKAWDE